MRTLTHRFIQFIYWNVWKVFIIILFYCTLVNHSMENSMRKGKIARKLRFYDCKQLDENESYSANIKIHILCKTQ